MKDLAKLLRVRNSMKALQQISWTISQIEKRYSVDNITENQAKEAVEVYTEFIPKIKRILDELSDELNETKEEK